ncbi:aromatic ring-hydroxylating dioxygenase subunit alpha [Microseira wollei]|uniref:Rieske (2Fe-2S) domain-containing protein n=1 Tax=Microseira wollei NIES-4236 TaxID=2530354 RepID=A0AAV3XEZ5_9CYAN|nr:aromatic ring-hydroxylating dioxygenase subunit alpha [Microseira wollei]GET38947.1 Rieske (2Fe-2S) domain-containing protein [Microseira wollei NIES-4236]
MLPDFRNTESLISASHRPEISQEFNWINCWYPIIFVQDLPQKRPYGFSVYDEPLVLFRDANGKFGCLQDICPHRTAKLSQGQVVDGKLECLYHGWQFNANGKCLHIPQLSPGSKIPHNACVKSFTVIERQGIVWMWPGNAEESDEKLIPVLAELDDPKFIKTDYLLDLPYDQSYFIENVIDPAHFPINHNGKRFKRKDAQPLEMEVIDVSSRGIRGRYRNQQTNEPWVSLEFIAPNLVRYASWKEQSLFGGADLYSIPTGRGKCKILLRNYDSVLTWRNKLQPRWLEHCSRHFILEGDAELIREQQMQIENLAKSMKELFLPLKTSDVLVIEYRKWLDKYGIDLPFYQGYETSNLNGVLQSVEIGNRFTRHTQICNSCNRVHQISNRVKQSFIIAAIILAAIAMITENYQARIIGVSLFILSLSIASAAQKVKILLERNYLRQYITTEKIN